MNKEVTVLKKKREKNKNSKEVFGRLRREEKSIRKELIIDNADNLLKTQPFEMMNVRSIANEVGISPASIYRYFSGRDELLVELLYRELQNIKKKITELKSDVMFGLEDFTKNVIDYLIDNESMFDVCCHFLIQKEKAPVVSQKFTDLIISFQKIFEDALNEIVVTEDIVMSTNVFLSRITGVVILFYNYPDLTTEEKRDLMYETALRSISDQLFNMKKSIKLTAG